MFKPWLTPAKPKDSGSNPGLETCSLCSLYALLAMWIKRNHVIKFSIILLRHMSKCATRNLNIFTSFQKLNEARNLHFRYFFFYFLTSSFLFIFRVSKRNNFSGIAFCEVTFWWNKNRTSHQTSLLLQSDLFLWKYIIYYEIYHWVFYNLFSIYIFEYIVQVIGFFNFRYTVFTGNNPFIL